jgi:iron-sulfur cluster assembly accessory protein
MKKEKPSQQQVKVQSVTCTQLETRQGAEPQALQQSTETRMASRILLTRLSLARQVGPLRLCQRTPSAPSAYLTVSSRSMAMVTKTSAGSPAVDFTSPPPPQSASSINAIVTDELSVTASCMNRVKSLASKRDEPSYLRVFVDAGGCSGFQYKFDLTLDKDEAVDTEEDVVFETDGARVVVDQASLDIIKGSTIDFVQEMIRSSFAVVDNPQSESACGCGSSFAVKNFGANPALD